ncbi:hypothetical protein XENTR_v10014992 [Xenopus tropicalis]|uniref:Flap endonuclease GEN homolog 1 n=1 Tax=Xenopus tropicalis TaxID=8364 RepID=A0A6I8PYB0_XENTR|nr:flap endonuclease GEN homolog 1 isoform X1 [Xenopus tropicalis]KAE8605155.1 hypothetical protein XENTR_v10014992 [Xenopus tropicalis]
MGVTDLWSILGPVKKHVPLESLAGKTLAVDLSIWVCEAQMVKQMIGVVHKPHLRNLFFRISSLNLLGVKLVFVSEGEAPKIKAETMSKRNEMRYGPSASAAPPKAGRSYFKSVLKECLLMLECLGIPWVQAAGEAEAMCAYLNAHGYVDGCITNDGDVFLYGAQTVYRNFTMNVKDPHVDCYEVSKIKAQLGLDREELVGLAILLGCDYLPKGVPGVRKVQALKLIEMLNGESLLQRFYQWEKDCNERGTKAPKKKPHCSVCCHPGSAKDHERNGCKMCGSDRFCEPHDYDYRCPCDWHKEQREKQENSVEFNIKRKSLRCEGFPYRQVIDEFLINKNKLVKVLKWGRPSLQCFQNFTAERMDWPRHYSCEKLLVLLTYYDMNERKAGRENGAQLQAVRIVKTRIRNGSPCFEIEWVKPDSYAFADDHPAESPLVTIEEESLFRAAYPHVVTMFHKEKQEAEENKLKCKKSKPKSKAADDLDDVASLLSELSLKPVSEKQPPLELQEDGGDSDSVHEKPARDSNFLSLSSDADSGVERGILLDTKTDSEFFTSPTADNEPSNPLCSSPAPSNTQHLTAASPNISAVISELQLSSIDWDSTSFSKSPQAEERTKGSKEVGERGEFCYKPTTNNLETSGNKSKEVQNGIARPGTSNKVHLTNSKQSNVEDFHKLPLKERVLLKNAVQSGVPYPGKMQTKPVPVKPVPLSLHNQGLGNHSSKNSVPTTLGIDIKEKVHQKLPMKLSRDPSQQESRQPPTSVCSRAKPQNQGATGPKTYNFVKNVKAVPLVPVNTGNKMGTLAASKSLGKKSVCQKGTLYDQEEKTYQHKMQATCPSAIVHPHSNGVEGAKLHRPPYGDKEVKQNKENSPPRDNLICHSGLNPIFLSPDSKAATKKASDCAAEDSDGDDSIISVDSPLPLAERLKLRLLQK